VTAIHPDGESGRHAIVSFTSVSLDPPLVGFSPSDIGSWARLRECGKRFCVNILSEGQEGIGRIIAAGNGNKFDG